MKYTKLILTFLLFILLTTNLFAQVIQEWVQRYDWSIPYPTQEIVSSMVADEQGNVYVTGNYCDTIRWYSLTIKYNSSGVHLWDRIYAGGASTRAYSIAVDNMGNVYVTGETWPEGGGNSDYLTIKYNTSGVQMWVKTFSGGSYDVASAVTVDDSGNVYVTGSFCPGIYNYGTIKYNSSGDLLWVRSYNRGAWDSPSDIAVDRLGNVYVTGKGGTNSNIINDYATVKYNSAGVQQWARIYDTGTSTNDGANSIAVDDSGNVYITGTDNGDFATIKYNSTGDSLWVRRYNGPGNGGDGARSLVLDGSGNVYVTGSSTGIGTGSDYTTIKYNPSGVQQWVSTYNGPGNGGDGASSVEVDNSGNVYVTGSSPGIGTGNDYATVKYNNGGVQLWVIRYNGPANSTDNAISLGLDSSANVYVSGSSIGINTSWDYATIKYIAPPPLSAFNLQSPSVGDTITSFPFSTTPITFTWNTSALGASYKWIFGTSLPTRMITKQSGVNSLTFTLRELDSILASLGVTLGNKLNGSWDVWAFRPNPPQNDSLKAANGPRIITLKRGIPELTAFNLLSPPNGTQIITSPYNDSLVHMKWTRSGDWTTYKWKFGSPTIANPILTFESNNSCLDSVFSIKNSSLDSALVSLGMQQGEAKVGEWAVWAYNGIDSLKSSQTWSMTLKRSGISVLFNDPFSTGTGKWTITSDLFNRDRINCVWQIFSEPYFNPYSLPPSSVSPVFSADGGRCGYNTTTRTTATITNNINCSGYENVTLEFDNDWNAKSSSTNTDSVVVEASYNGGMTWTQILLWRQYDVRCTHEFISLPGAGNIPNLKIRFIARLNWNGINPSWWTIDNVLILGDFVTGVTKNESQIPTEHALLQNYPNPFNPSTKIKFDIPKISHVKLIIYNVLGREIKTLVDEKLNAGRYDINWNGSDYPSGVYIYKLVAGDFVDVKRMVLIK